MRDIRLGTENFQACEYTPDGKLAQVRERFFLGKKKILLYTERLHFYRRFTIKGIRHIVFYQLPSYPHFYAELINLLQVLEHAIKKSHAVLMSFSICFFGVLKDAYQSKKNRGDHSQTCSVLYSSYDAPRLAGTVGSQRASQMLTSDQSVHMFVSDGS